MRIRLNFSFAFNLTLVLRVLSVLSFFLSLCATQGFLFAEGDRPAFGAAGLTLFALSSLPWPSLIEDFTKHQE